MSYQLRVAEPVHDAIRRIATEQIGKAVEELAVPIKDEVEGVHNARKCIKKVRAVLRLVRDEIGDDVYHLENIRFRDAARHLAPVRDSSAMVESLDRLLAWAGNRPGRDVLKNARMQTAAIQHETQRNNPEHAELFAQVRELLLVAGDKVKLWPVERNDFRALRGGILRTYRGGRDSFGEAIADITPENLHEWRKDVKYLWYQIRILRPVWPEALRPLASELRHLSESLGDDHDLITLRSLLLVRPELAGDEGELEMVIGLVDGRRLELQEEAFARGARIFSEKPKAFVRRIASYWEIWQKCEV